MLSPKILNDIVWAKPRPNRQQSKNIWKSRAWMWSDDCLYWWPGTIIWYENFRAIDDSVGVCVCMGPAVKRLNVLHIWDPFYEHELTLIPAWINNHLPGKMWNEIAYLFTTFNDCIAACEKQFNSTLCDRCNYLSVLGSKLTHAGRYVCYVQVIMRSRSLF